MKAHPKIIDRILAALREAIRFVSSATCDRTAIVPARSSRSRWRCRLRENGHCWNEDVMPQKYRFLDANGLIQKPKPGQEFDCVVAVDAASFERLGDRVGECVARRKSSSTLTITPATPATRPELGFPTAAVHR